MPLQPPRPGVHALGAQEACGGLQHVVGGSLAVDACPSPDETFAHRGEGGARQLARVALGEPGQGVDHGDAIRHRREHPADAPEALVDRAIRRQRRREQADQRADLLHVPARLVQRVVFLPVADASQSFDGVPQLAVGDPPHLAFY